MNISAYYFFQFKLKRNALVFFFNKTREIKHEYAWKLAFMLVSELHSCSFILPSCLVQVRDSRLQNWGIWSGGHRIRHGL